MILSFILTDGGYNILMVWHLVSASLSLMEIKYIRIYRVAISRVQRKYSLSNLAKLVFYLFFMIPLKWRNVHIFSFRAIRLCWNGRPYLHMSQVGFIRVRLYINLGIRYFFQFGIRFSELFSQKLDLNPKGEILNFFFLTASTNLLVSSSLTSKSSLICSNYFNFSKDFSTFFYLL